MLRSLFLVILFAFSVEASAQYYSYNYLQGAYGRVDLDLPGASLDGNGIGLRGSYAIDEAFHVFGDYQTASLNAGADFDLFEVGIGYHASVSPYMDLIAKLSYVDVEVDFGASDDGVAFGLGLRGSASDALELYGGLDYIRFDRFDSEFRANTGILLHLTDEIGVGLSAMLWDDVNIFQVNARLNFQ